MPTMLPYLIGTSVAFLAAWAIAALALRAVRDCNTARRKAALRRARLERDWKEGRWDA